MCYYNFFLFFCAGSTFACWLAHSFASFMLPPVLVSNNPLVWWSSHEWKFSKCKWCFSLLSFCGPLEKSTNPLGTCRPQAENSWPCQHLTPQCAGTYTAEACALLPVCCRLTRLSLQIIHNLSSMTAALSLNVCSAHFPHCLFFKDTCGGNFWSSRDDWEFDDCRLESLVQALFLSLCLRAQVFWGRALGGSVKLMCWALQCWAGAKVLKCSHSAKPYIIIHTHEVTREWEVICK